MEIPKELSKTNNSYTPLWGLGVSELFSHNLESQGREIINSLLGKGWILLHIYTLKYKENGIWRERPMAILGKTKNQKRVPS